MMNSKAFLDMLRKLDLGFITGVADSGLRDFLVYVEQHPEEISHIRAANEGQAVGIAAGHYLATKKVPIVYLQNSGLGNAVNPLTSLADKEVYGIPMILFVAWRGRPGEQDEPQHAKMGRIMLDVLRILEIPFEIATGEDGKTLTQLNSLKEQTLATRHPVALVFPKGVIEEEKGENEALEGMKREEALETLLAKIGQNPVVSTTGYTSREIFEIRERKGQGHELDFLCVGSMGHASSIALGIAHSLKKQVYIIDGDGALCMHMGAVAAIGSLGLENLYHIVIDNGVHESTGGQPTVSRHVNWKLFFGSLGYKETSVTGDREVLEGLDFVGAKRPAALVVRVVPGSRKDLGRPTKTPAENREAFMRFLEEHGSSAQALKEILEKERPPKVLLFADAAFEKSGAKEKLLPVLQNYEMEVFSSIEPNPTLEQVERGVEACKKFGPDLTVAVGGGSVIDTAKAANLLAAQEGVPAAYIKKEKEVSKPGKPFVAIPTTAGTGTEATRFSVVYIEKIKYSLSHEFLVPTYAIIDAELTYSLPPSVTADCGMDALAQCIEAFWSTNATEESKQYSKEGIALIWPNLSKAVKSPVPQAREAMAQGAHLSGKAINIAKTTACHALSYPFTAHFGIPHGHAVALTLPEMIEFNAKAMEKDDLADLFSLLGANTPTEAAERIRNLMKDIGLETTLRQLGIKDLQIIQELVVKEVNIERLSNNPRPLAIDDIRLILQGIF